jgi:hypothetical protein
LPKERAMPTDPANNVEGDHAFNLFAETVTRYLDWGLTSEELLQFNAQLLADAESRELFVRFVRLHGMLSERALSIEPSLVEDDMPILVGTNDSNHAFNPASAGDAAHDPAGESLDDAVIQPAIREEELRIASAEASLSESALLELARSELTLWEPARQDAATQRIPPERDRHLPIRSGIAALLILGFSLTIWFWLRNSNRDQSVVPAQTAGVYVPVPADPADDRVILGDAINAEFDAPFGPPSARPISSGVASSGVASSGQPIRGRPMPDGPLFLKKGWIRLNFPTGVTAIVEAPAHFSVQSKTLMTLASGRISAEVPLAGHGFTVQAPLWNLVDLGTEFGIAVDPNGRHLVEVYRGLVQLNRPAAAGPEAGSEVLSQGSARLVDSMTQPTISTPLVATAFLRVSQFDRWSNTLDLGAKASLTDRWKAFSEQLCRDPSLALYYTFNDRETSPDAVKNHACSTAGQYDLSLARPTSAQVAAQAPTWTDGRLPGIAALDFNPGQCQRLLLPSYPLTPNGDLSATAWVYARSLPSWGSIAKSWGNTRSGAFHFGLLADTGLLEIELDGTRPGGPRISESQRFPVGRWVHVAFTSNGKTLRLYRDGKEVASCPSRPIAVDQPVKTISFGVKTDDDGVTPSAAPVCGYWDGKLGDFALFHRALSPAEIARMSEFGPH